MKDLHEHEIFEKTQRRGFVNLDIETRNSSNPFLYQKQRKARMLKQAFNNSQKLSHLKHISVRKDFFNGKNQYFLGDQQIEKPKLEDEPLFLAFDVEDLRDHPETREYLKNLKFFSGKSHEQNKILKVNTDLPKTTDSLASPPALLNLHNLQDS